MFSRAVGALAAVAVVVPSCQPGCEPEPPGPPGSTTTTAPAEPSTTTVPTTTAPSAGIVSVTIEGQGSGHGRGLSAWGNYGSAVTLGWSWQQILDHYYGGTSAGSAANTPIGIRLVALDGAAATGVVSTTAQATWNGVQASSLQAREIGPNTYSIYSAPDLRCPSTVDGWALVANGVAGPITFSTPVEETTGAAGDVLGLCQANGSVIHYRGTITATNDGSGNNRTVNRTLMENYLRGVLSREVSTSWGNAGGGAGMDALRAQSVAARSFALSQNRYPSYGAQTCDTTSCQVYGGAAHRATPTAAISQPGRFRICETGNDTFECANTDRGIVETAGVIRVWPNGNVVSTEYSASHGPYSAGGPFPSVDDTASDVPGNPSYQWTRSIDAAAIATRYQLGELTAASTEPDPNTPYVEVWDHRVRLVGSLRTVVVSGWDFRNAFDLPSPGFTITGVVTG
ncbi:MAG: SpoIID/LytB domain-containing protein [Ilumatobacteraceae bacterium]